MVHTYRQCGNSTAASAFQDPRDTVTVYTETLEMPIF